MPGAIAAATFCESLADASVAAADAAFASLYDGMQKMRQVLLLKCAIKLRWFSIKKAVLVEKLHQAHMAATLLCRMVNIRI